MITIFAEQRRQGLNREGFAILEDCRTIASRRKRLLSGEETLQYIGHEAICGKVEENTCWKF